jgi:transcription-repair coupling factor (superfamily II helicase)
LCIGDLASGFVWPEESLAVITDMEIFGAQRRRKPSAPKVKTKLLSFDELKQDDLVVHSEHGIGQYRGLAKLVLEGTGGEFLLITYRDGDRLYLPVDRMNLIQKYMGVEGVAPTLDKMGGKSWERVRDKVKKSVEKIAAELLRLYASRKVLEGWAFSDLTDEMREFEAGFPFEETPDQLVGHRGRVQGHDLPQSHGSADLRGRGLRQDRGGAAGRFLAVLNGKQVAVLVPTTVLAEQHYATFSRRFERFPVNIACLSRFRSRKEQREIVEGLEGGQDRHRDRHPPAAAKGRRFKDLGLLISGRGAAFRGQAQGEDQERCEPTVDVLTLTATPIPRTLHMSLMGIRDISLIHPAGVQAGDRHLHLPSSTTPSPRPPLKRSWPAGDKSFSCTTTSTPSGPWPPV